MAEDKTQTVFVRLAKGFPAGVTHRRGGVALIAGPTPVEAAVTADQLEALKADPNVEFVSGKDAQKLSDANDTLTGAASEPVPTAGPRNYGSDTSAPAATEPKSSKKG